jgi:hypothetical protein
MHPNRVVEAAIVLNTPLTHPHPLDFLQPLPTSQTDSRSPQQPYPLRDDRGHTNPRRDPQHPREPRFHDQTTMGDFGIVHPNQRWREEGRISERQKGSATASSHHSGSEKWQAQSAVIRADEANGLVA